MSHDTKINTFHSLSSEEKKSLSSGKKGIEREAIRVLKNSLISDQSHKNYMIKAIIVVLCLRWKIQLIVPNSIIENTNFVVSNSIESKIQL